MNDQLQKAQLFKELHQKGNPLILCNIWNVETAKSVESLGGNAIATSSWFVAKSHGYKDGENIPLQLVLSNAESIKYL